MVLVLADIYLAILSCRGSWRGSGWRGVEEAVFVTVASKLRGGAEAGPL